MPDFIFDLPALGIFLTVFATVSVVALLLHLLFSLPPMVERAARFGEVSAAVITVCGALFGLSVTFLANSVWNTEDKAREAVSGEARAIRVMEVYLDATQEPPHTDLYRMLADYGRGVAEEWYSMADGGPGIVAETSLRNIYASVIRDVSRSDQDRILQQRLLVELDALSTARQQRLSIAQDVVSLPQWVLVMGLGLLLLMAVAVNHAPFPFARRVALAGVTLAVSFMLFVIVQHDRPFRGDTALTPQSILRASGNEG
jgi:hypothetical protein